MSEWVWILFALGIIFLLFEIVLPGAVVGSLGVLILLIATYGAAREVGALAAGGLFLGAIAFSFACFVLFFRSPFRKWIVLENDQADQPVSQDLEIGLAGLTVTDLHPSGKALFVINSREKQVDVLTNAEFIEKDQRVRISKIEGNRVFVNLL